MSFNDEPLFDLEGNRFPFDQSQESRELHILKQYVKRVESQNEKLKKTLDGAEKELDSYRSRKSDCETVVGMVDLCYDPMVGWNGKTISEWSKETSLEHALSYLLEEVKKHVQFEIVERTDPHSFRTVGKAIARLDIKKKRDVT